MLKPLSHSEERLVLIKGEAQDSIFVRARPNVASAKF